VFDHVTIRVSDIEVSRRFYELALATLDFGEPSQGGDFFEWDDLSISAAREDKPVTSNLHVAFVARSRDAVDQWWRTLVDAGFRDDGAPGPRPLYRADYYGAFVLDPDGNSIEGVHHDGLRTDGLVIDHLWMRVRDLSASRDFYDTIAPVCGFSKHEGRWTHFYRGNVSFTLVEGDDPTQNVHIAFAAPDNATVEEFHRVALEAGYEDNGPPGERRVYHAGYYGAFVLDPDGNNVEAVCHNRD
jgi:catechol 2,3-dioxygenase-like lactoylglutathione lyase family enzyme